MNLDKRYLNYIDTFAKIGLSRIDTLTYITLLEQPGISPTEISKQTKLYRPSIYTSLERLKDLNLVHISSKGKRVIYAAESPERLESVFKKVERDFFSEIEDLHHMYHSGKNKLYISVTSGTEAIRNIYSDVVEQSEPGGVYYRYSAMDYKKVRDMYKPDDYERIRDKKELERYVITGARHVTKKRLGRTVKMVPEKYNLFKDSINVMIYSDKVSIIDYNSESTITIIHKEFAEFQKTLFKMVFDNL
ncbi:MAG: helix-turn-helix domain-containing protein [Patescibacteria group bacterium]